MATTTPNFGWPVPTSTDLVKNGATAIEALGDAIDASMADLEGGTTGQILAKNSNTDMDFVWIANDQGDITGVTAGTGISGGGTSGTVTVTNSMATAIDAKGDLVPGTGADTFARLAVGANNTVLTADSSTATGLKWATPASGGGMTLLATTTLSGTSTQITGLSGYKNIYVVVRSPLPSASSAEIIVTLNNDTTSNRYYTNSGGANTQSAQFTRSNIGSFPFPVSNSATEGILTFTLPDYANTTTWKQFHGWATAPNSTTTTEIALINAVGLYNQTSAITSFELRIGSGASWTSGTVLTYGVN